MFFSNSVVNLSDGTPLHLLVREINHPQWLIVTHGIGEHASRYTFLQGLFSQGPNICLYDLRGHGESGGAKGEIGDFSTYAQDLSEIISFLRKSYRMNQFFLMGHSLGGMIVADYCMQFRATENIRGLSKVFLSSPCVRPYGKLPLFLSQGTSLLERSLSWKFSQKALSMKLPLNLFLAMENLSHDPRVIQEYKKDPLNTKFFQLDFLLKLNLHCEKVWNKPFGLETDIPLRASIGLEDKIVCVKAFKRYFKKYEPNTQIKLFAGGYHELHNEIIRLRRPFLEYFYEFIMDRPLEYKVS